MKTCFFIGHHDAPDRLREQLDEEVERLVREEGVTSFLVGYHGNFDRMATAAVRQAREHHPQLRAWLLLAYHPSERKVPAPQGFDGTYYPVGLVGVPRRFAIPKANAAALNECDFLIAHVTREGGNAGALLRQARKREKEGILRIIRV